MRRAAAKSGKRKALLVAVHHPPYSNGGHAGSPEVLAALDQACHAAGIMPDVLLSGHAHNYQRHTRRIAFNGKAIQIPFIVAGCGGHNDLPVAAAHGQVIGDRTYDKALRGYGFLDVNASSNSVKIEMWQVPSTSKTPFDSVTVNLATNSLSVEAERRDGQGMNDGVAEVSPHLRDRGNLGCKLAANVCIVFDLAGKSHSRHSQATSRSPRVRTCAPDPPAWFHRRSSPPAPHRV